jgi:hypothetical protein
MSEVVAYSFVDYQFNAEGSSTNDDMVLGDQQSVNLWRAICGVPYYKTHNCS